MSRELGPGALADRLASLPVTIDGLAVERGSVAASGYYDGARRPTGIAILSGPGEPNRDGDSVGSYGNCAGRGECVAWSTRDQEAFATACNRLSLPARATLGEVSLVLAEELADPYHRAAVEGAAIDLALRQSGTNPFALARRKAEPVAFCWSIGPDVNPFPGIEALLARSPEARIKIDVPPEGWPAETWEALADTRRIVVADFKRESTLDQVRLAHAALPEAWLEDPPVEVVTLDQRGEWAKRVSLDGYVLAAVDLENPEIRPAAVNVKAPRVGGWLEPLRCLEECRRRGLHAYIGGMFEVDVGRAQSRVLASLYTAAAWNDLAPLLPDESGALASSPWEPDDRFVGFAPRDSPPAPL